MLHHLEELAGKLGIEVRYEAAAGRVGTGVLRGRKIAVIDADLRVPQRVSALASLLAEHSVDDMCLAPEVRKLLDACSPARADAPADENTSTASMDSEARPEEEAGPESSS